MLTAIAVVIIVMLVIALALKCCEASGGTVGDSSMVPGVLMLGIFIVLVILVAGWFNGNMVIQFK